jgi:formyl-CoA transferase
MKSQPLQGLRVLDLSRVLAGPYCTMVLGDLGADVLKVEPPDGDETRAWGPPFAAGESAYYLCINRNKRGMVVNLKVERGQALLRELAHASDILVENFRPGTLARYGLDYESFRADHPRLVYCSISGFGQTGPLRDRPGYDFMIQAMGGIMSVTGDPDGEPMKVGVAVADLFAGSNAVIAILAALQARERTGMGQYIDISLFDSQIGWLANVASNYLISGERPKRYGNAHPNIVPYQSFAAADGWFALAVGNDKQFVRLCELIGKPEWGHDKRFVTNAMRVANREVLIASLKSVFISRRVEEWLSELGAVSIPCGPINTLDKVFAEPQVAAREMLVAMDHPVVGNLQLVGSPLKLSETPVEYRLPPPGLGEHTSAILQELLGYTEGEIDSLKAGGVIS